MIVHPDAPSLRQLQDAMAARILGCTSADAAPPLDWLAVPPTATAAERLLVYANGYPARVRDALADTCPALARLVGDAAFTALARRYAATVPLTSYNLNDAAARLPAFLRTDALGGEWPCLPDLAAFECQVAQAFHARERTPLDPTALSWTLDEWDRAVLELQPSVAVMASRWPLLDLWQAVAPPAAAVAEDVPRELLIRRAGLTVRCEPIGAGEALALRLLLAGHTLGASMERLDAAGHDPAAVSAWCARWMQNGMVAGAQVVSELP
jgi:hypothetical protein